jgi:acyl-CoA synthetase (NDP forming)
VPAAAVVETARQCAAKGVSALVVLTAGFAEVGGEGRARQDELLAVCREAGMRMVGPNCLGVANLHHEIALNPDGFIGRTDESQMYGREAE